jgi:HPt (histidine-containing phosphotransfer) domain-containing protein
MYPNSSSAFQFNTLLDVVFLEELFEGDIEYAATVFGDFLQDLPAYWEEVEQAFRQEDRLALRSAVHKCKTLFGYVGHTQILEILQAFEAQCDVVRDFYELKMRYFELIKMKEGAEILIGEELMRLKEYCQNN